MKRNKKCVLDINSVPKLKGDKDAYYINRKYEVGILKYEGEIPLQVDSCHYNGRTIPLRTYSFAEDNEKKVLQTWAYCLDTCVGVCPDDGLMDNGYFLSVGFHNKYIFVPDRKQLSGISNRINNFEKNINKKYVVVKDPLKAYVSYEPVQAIKKWHRMGEKVFIFNDYESAMAKFEEFMDDCGKKCDQYIKLVTVLLETSMELLKGHEVEKQYEVTARNLKVGDRFIFKNEHNKVYRVLENDGKIVHLDGELVIPGSYYVLPCNRIRDAKLEKEYFQLRRVVQEIGWFNDKVMKKKQTLKRPFTLFTTSNPYFFRSFKTEVEDEYARLETLFKEIVNNIHNFA